VSIDRKLFRFSAGYGVDPVIVDQGASIAGDVGELDA